jgi:hypothetical protein
MYYRVLQVLDLRPEASSLSAQIKELLEQLVPSPPKLSSFRSLLADFAFSGEQGKMTEEMRLATDLVLLDWRLKTLVDEAHRLNAPPDAMPPQLAWENPTLAAWHRAEAERRAALDERTRMEQIRARMKRSSEALKSGTSSFANSALDLQKQIEKSASATKKSASNQPPQLTIDVFSDDGQKDSGTEGPRRNDPSKRSKPASETVVQPKDKANSGHRQPRPTRRSPSPRKSRR